MSDFDKRSQDLSTIHSAARRRRYFTNQDSPAHNVGQESTLLHGSDHLREELLPTGLRPYTGVLGEGRHEQGLPDANDDAGTDFETWYGVRW